ncbi:MAG: hypothetical protein ACOX8T_09745 [Bacillota bacterium]|jgi:hypothetical protein
MVFLSGGFNQWVINGNKWATCFGRWPLAFYQRMMTRLGKGFAWFRMVAQWL